jgi:hypothetical protein
VKEKYPIVVKGGKVNIEGHVQGGHYDTTPKARLEDLPVIRGKKPFQVGHISTTVDGKMQELRKLRPYHRMILHIPPSLPTEAQIVLHSLFQCFEKAGHISEGLIGDLLWGFAQTTPPVPPELTLRGLWDLERCGYLKFQAKDNAYVSLQADAASGAFVRYQPKLLEMIYEGPAT